MNTLLKKNNYLSFLRSRLKSRIDFLEKYSVLIPEYYNEDHLKYLRSITLYEAPLHTLKDVEGKVNAIEEYIANSLMSLASDTRFAAK